MVFQPHGKRLKASEGKTILEAAREVGVDITSICGGRGVCGKCRIIIRGGEECLSAPSKTERHTFSDDDFSSGFRLACQTAVAFEGKTVVEVPSESRVNQQKLLLKGLERSVELSPAVKKVAVHLKKPSLLDTRSDVDRLLDALRPNTSWGPQVDYEALKKAPLVLRKGDWTVTATVWKDGEVISVEPGATKGCYGFAVDIGTTKLAGYLVDLTSGKIVAMASMMNPQIAYGEDVISRIRYIMEADMNLSRLQQAIAESINNLINEACETASVPPSEIYDMTVAGNTAMHHIFLGVPPNYVALLPYPAALQSPMDIKARELSVGISPGAYVHALPAIAGFVGGDAVADILATKIHEADDLSLMIDIGTNTEIVLGNKDGLVACSCASGPAFEGAHIRNGMRAATGAIERVWIDPKTLELGYKTIDNQKPRGLCGSAVIDITAEMLKAGIIDYSGKFNAESRTIRLRRNDKSVEFVIARKDETLIESDIVITQGDVREVQLAKAAIYTGASILMKHRNVRSEEIERIFLAGAFGNYIDPQSARIIGMYPDVPLERVKFVGNTAGSGARMALLSVEARKEAGEIAKRVEYVELGADLDFQKEFLKATYLPHQEADRFPNVVKILGKIRNRG